MESAQSSVLQADSRFVVEYGMSYILCHVTG